MKRKVIVLFLACATVAACGEYQQLLKSDDYSLVYREAIAYYNRGEYKRARELFSSVRDVFRGRAQEPTMEYYIALCAYNQKEYELAAGEFRRFVKNFPENENVEDCMYMIGYCNYLQSPNARLDQGVTEDAIKDFQLFLDLYPGNYRKEQVNEYMDILRDKLSYKDFLSAENYYRREHYKSAVICFENCLKDYPGTKYREEIMYMLFSSKFEIAVNSYEALQYERFTEAKEEYYFFIDEYPNSRHAGQMIPMYATINAYLERLAPDNDD
ncbi:MAG: outer membrane protein assembly factor BamD [Odoribacteraceae bacterium]|jgi:outer membrane protein assembly factor BamD|nr:outer membrane protein assembly factor BamD [Odoribacteraceae bacterium]